MYSLPFISHHLFLEAVTSEDHAHARPTRQERPSVRPAAPVNAIPLEVLDGRKPLLAGSARPLRVCVAQPLS